MAARRRKWEFDWAGRHGTAWGTFNACLTTLTAACTGRYVQTHWPVPTVHMVYAAIVATVLGVIVVLLRAAVRKTATPGATIVYKICCWAGVGVWLVVMYRQSAWSVRFFLAAVGALIVMALVAGVLAGLADDDEPKQKPADGQSKPAGSTAPEEVAAADAQRQRDAKAVEWEQRLARLCDLPGIEVPNIELWEGKNGYTVEAVCPEGGSSWTAIAARTDAIAADLDLVAGCRVGVQMGRSRRVALIEVLDVSTLHEEQPYPDDYSVLSIEDPLPGAVRDDGSEIGPTLRSHNMLLVGENGSGKTNAGHCIGVGVARCDDALLWDIDFSAGLFLDLLHLFMQGKTRQPAVDWAAWDEREALLMTRAALRGHRARVAGYRDLMREANDDKVPVSDRLPAVIIRADEIKRITGAPSEFPDLNGYFKDIIFEARKAAFRMVLLGLRATADVVGTDIQAQCQVIAVTRAKSDAEYAWAFGWHSGATVADAPYPGCGFISLESGARPVAEKWRRLRPLQLGEVSMAVDGRQPEMDELTRLALDGRNPDGSPMPDLLPGELDCYSKRWERFRARFGGDHPSQPAPPASPDEPSAAGVAAAGGVLTLSPQQAVADLNRVMADLDRAVEAAKARGDGDELPPHTQQVRDEFQAILNAEGFGPDVDWGDPANWENLQESAPQPGDEDNLLTLIREAGMKGARPRDLLPQLKDRFGIVISRDTLHERLNSLKAAGKVANRSHGKWTVL